MNLQMFYYVCSPQPPEMDNPRIITTRDLWELIALGNINYRNIGNAVKFDNFRIIILLKIQVFESVDTTVVDIDTRYLFLYQLIYKISIPEVSTLASIGHFDTCWTVDNYCLLLYVS